MDAFAHCLEAYASPSYHPMAEGIAVEGLRLCKEYLPRAYRDGGDLEARANMLAAAAMGAAAFQKGLGAIHSLSHPVGALYDTHHGLTNAVVMPYVLDFNREALWDKIDRLAAGWGSRGAFRGFSTSSLRFRRDLGIPHTLDRIGVDAARFEEMAAMAAVDPTAGQPSPPVGGGRARPLSAAMDGRGVGWGGMEPVDRWLFVDGKLANPPARARRPVGRGRSRGACVGRAQDPARRHLLIRATTCRPVRAALAGSAPASSSRSAVRR